VTSAVAPFDPIAPGAPRRPRVVLSARDHLIVDLTREKLIGRSFDFGDAVRALREATLETIPAGRVFLLGHSEGGPVIGSAISGIGVVDHTRGVRVVHCEAGGRVTLVRSLRP
jgi:hypothetical protein